MELAEFLMKSRCKYLSMIWKLGTSGLLRVSYHFLWLGKRGLVKYVVLGTEL